MELVQHHVPYSMATGIAFFFHHAERWSAPMYIVLLTALNEALFVAGSLGWPAWLAKVRRLFGFSIILLLLCCESTTYLRAMLTHWSLGRAGVWNAALDQIV